jgi:hypothetical protein
VDYAGAILPPNGKEWRVYGSKSRDFSWVEAANIYNSALKLSRRATTAKNAGGAAVAENLQRHGISVIIQLRDASEGVVGVLLIGKSLKGEEKVSENGLRALISVSNIVALAIMDEAGRS